MAATTIKPYIVRGARISNTQIIDVHHVYDLPTTIAPQARLDYARRASVSGFRMPRPAGNGVTGDSHPSIPFFQCTDVQAEALMGSPTKAQVTVIWTPVQGGGNPDPVLGIEIRITHGVTRLGAWLAFNASKPLPFEKKEMIHVMYDPQLSADTAPTQSGDPAKNARILKQPSQANPFIPDTMIEIYRWEDRSPFLFGKPYGAKLNSDRIWQCDPRTLLCVGITGDRSYTDPNQTRLIPQLRPFTPTPAQSAREKLWRVRYGFHYHDLPTEGIGWDHLAVYINERTGFPPANVDPGKGGYPGRKEGNGWKLWYLQNQIPFLPLRLPDITR